MYSWRFSLLSINVQCNHGLLVNGVHSFYNNHINPSPHTHTYIDIFHMSSPLRWKKEASEKSTVACRSTVWLGVEQYSTYHDSCFLESSLVLSCFFSNNWPWPDWFPSAALTNFTPSCREIPYLHFHSNKDNYVVVVFFIQSDKSLLVITLALRFIERSWG